MTNDQIKIPQYNLLTNDLESDMVSLPWQRYHIRLSKNTNAKYK